MPSGLLTKDKQKTIEQKTIEHLKLALETVNSETEMTTTVRMCRGIYICRVIMSTFKDNFLNF